MLIKEPKRLVIMLLCVILLGLGTGSSPQAKAQPFANGADVGWLSEMEKAGKSFYNDNGTKQDLLTILKAHGINSIRLRVWVHPQNGFSGKEDVVRQAVRARNMGFRVMINFHYSDSWADWKKQPIPAGWKNYSYDQIKRAVYYHTYNVMHALKANGVHPEWVQVGNEINDGLLWNHGRASTNMKQFAGIVKAGASAVKTISPDSKVVLHLSNGYDNKLYRSIFDGLRAYGVKWDVIGMSLYPTIDNWQKLNQQTLDNMNDMVSLYGKEVMISEVGMDASKPAETKAFLTDLILKTKSVSGNKGLGVFYWEPGAYGGWHDYKLGAFDSKGKITEALDAFLEK